MNEITTLNACPGGGCHAGCIHTTHVQDGQIVKIKNTIYPDGTEGVICLKGVEGASLPYHSDRLKYPLKRVGNRGEGKWERITWEQALDEIADKINEIREEYQPESVAIVPMFNSTVPLEGTHHLLGLRLQNLLQATEPFRGVGIDSNPVFANFFTFGEGIGSWMSPRSLVEGSIKYMVVWGGNPADMNAVLWRNIREAQKKGAKLVDIGLIFDQTAERADWWIPVKAGSDGALALAMINVIVNEKLYDREFVMRYTNGPFLVRTDNGRFLRESDISPKGDSQKYITWDKDNSQPRAVVRNSYGYSVYDSTLFGSYELGGIECKPVFQMLADMANQHTPENIEKLTGVPANTIIKLAQEYATIKPASIIPRFGLRYKNSGNTYRAMNILGAITGNIVVPEGETTEGHGLYASRLKSNDPSIIFPTEARARPLPLTQAIECMTSGEPYPIKALVVYGANPLHTIPNPRRWIEKVFPKLDLIVVNDIFMTATAEYADFVLPDCTVFERKDIGIGHGGYIVLMENAIEPMYECRPAIYFWSELAKRLGFGKYFNKNIKEWIDFRLSSVAGTKVSLTMERLKNEKMVRADESQEINRPSSGKKFRTPSGRIELYCEDLLPVGDALPVFREQLESPRSALSEKYPLVFNTANNRFFAHSLFANSTLTLKSYRSEPHISINPVDAEQRDIEEGDVVIVYNDRGNFKVKANVNQDVPPGVVHIPHGWWPKQFIEGHLQNLIMSLAGPENRDEAREVFWGLLAERMGIAGPASFLAMFAYSADTLFDCLCEVKKTIRVESVY